MPAITKSTEAIVATEKEYKQLTALPALVSGGLYADLPRATRPVPYTIGKMQVADLAATDFTKLSDHDILTVITRDRVKTPSEVEKQQSEERAKKLARRNELIDKLAGAWAKRLGEPVDGVEYQNKMRAAWDRNS